MDKENGWLIHLENKKLYSLLLFLSLSSLSSRRLLYSVTYEWKVVVKHLLLHRKLQASNTSSFYPFLKPNFSPLFGIHCYANLMDNWVTLASEGAHQHHCRTPTDLWFVLIGLPPISSYTSLRISVRSKEFSFPVDTIFNVNTLSIFFLIIKFFFFFKLEIIRLQSANPAQQLSFIENKITKSIYYINNKP